MVETRPITRWRRNFRLTFNFRFRPAQRGDSITPIRHPNLLTRDIGQKMSIEFVFGIVVILLLFVVPTTWLERHPEWTTQHKDKPQNHKQHKA